MFHLEAGVNLPEMGRFSGTPISYETSGFTSLEKTEIMRLAIGMDGGIALPCLGDLRNRDVIQPFFAFGRFAAR
jgi:hypothetical protein